MEEEVKTTNVRESKNKTPMIIGVVAVLVVILLAVLLWPKGISDSYFVSDNSKYVLTMEDNSFGAIKSHMVAQYKDDAITDMKTYYEFEDEEKAKTAFADLKGSEDFNSEQFEQSGKYLIFKQDADSYKEWTASQFKSLVDFYDNLDDEVQEESQEAAPVEE